MRHEHGEVSAVNVERGIFGIIENVNAKDDPLIWKALTTPGEVIFSNVLLKDGTPYWEGDDREVPDSGRNSAGDWHAGKKDKEGEEIHYSHPNARYTMRLGSLDNCDPVLETPAGVKVNGIIYGGRDSDTLPPVYQSFHWNHGVVTVGASLESETTAATLGKAGVRKFNIMANLDFVSISLGRYVLNHIDFGRALSSPPAIFSVNYFLRGASGDFLTDKQAKRVWLKWMELRVFGDADAIMTPIGNIPHYRDLKHLFSAVLSQDYPEEAYREQFSLRIVPNLAKVDRILKIYEGVPDAPQVVTEELQAQRQRLLAAQKLFGDTVSPDRFL